MNPSNPGQEGNSEVVLDGRPVADSAKEVSKAECGEAYEAKEENESDEK